MSKSVAETLGVWLVLAVCGPLVGCAGAGDRLPVCKGRAVPINALPAVAVAPAELSAGEAGVAEARGGGEHDAH